MNKLDEKFLKRDLKDVMKRLEKNDREIQKMDKLFGALEMRDFYKEYPAIYKRRWIPLMEEYYDLHVEGADILRRLGKFVHYEAWLFGIELGQAMIWQAKSVAC